MADKAFVYTLDSKRMRLYLHVTGSTDSVFRNIVYSLALANKVPNLCSRETVTRASQTVQCQSYNFVVVTITTVRMLVSYQLL